MSTNNFVCPILISGTQILEGQGQMIVCAVGNRSFNGRNRELLSKEIALPKPREKEEATPPLPAPDRGVNESHDKVELGWSFDDVVKRAFLMLEKRYENKVYQHSELSCYTAL